MSRQLKLGIYEHYKGFRYLVLGTARHSETQEILVVYVPLYQVTNNTEAQMAVRPLDMFLEFIDLSKDPQKVLRVPRFKHIASECNNYD